MDIVIWDEGEVEWVGHDWSNLAAAATESFVIGGPGLSWPSSSEREWMLK